jgi:hypothetical protein
LKQFILRGNAAPGTSLYITAATKKEIVVARFALSAMERAGTAVITAHIERGDLVVRAVVNGHRVKGKVIERRVMKSRAG